MNKKYVAAICLLLAVVWITARASYNPSSAVAIGGTSASIGGGALLAGQCASGTVSVANATTTMVVAASPNTYPGDGILWYAYVSASGTVTIKACALIALTPTGSTYNVRVIN